VEWDPHLRNTTHEPRLHFVAVLTLALGMRVNTAIFSIFNVIPLPYEIQTNTPCACLRR